MAENEPALSSRRQTIVIAGVALAGALFLILIWFFLLRVPYAPAFTGINSTDALTITQELDRLKTPYELADDGTSIMVPEDQVDAVRVNILGGELPLKGAVGFELFNKTDMGLSEFAQKINYQRALQGELARTIMALDQVETARVHLSLPESGIFEQDRRLAKASITVATKIGGDIDPSVVRGIQQLVAAAVPDLQAANVAILDARGQLLSPAPFETVAAALTPEQQERQSYEQTFVGKIEDAIRAAGLSMPLTVRVTALRSFRGGNPDAENDADNLADTGGPEEVARDGALNVQLAVAVEPGPRVRETLLNAAKDAMGYDRALGDTLDIQVDPAMAGTQADPVPSPRTRQSSWDDQAQPALPSLPLWPFAAVALAALLLFLIARWRKASSKPMNADDRETFSAKLKSLLDEDGRNGQPTV